jgi:hypothetical protein
MMTEEEWLLSADPQKMLSLLEGKASERKYRLFGVACCRRAERFFPTRLLSNAVDQVERYAEGVIGGEALRAVRAQVEQSRAGRTGQDTSFHFQYPVSQLCVSDIAYAIPRVLNQLIAEMAGAQLPKQAFLDTQAFKEARQAMWEAESPAQARLLREIVGSPFRCVTIHPSWLAWESGTIPKLARGMYEEEAFDRLPVLADALEEAGCADAEILNHCRRPGEHVRGCWVIDLLLGK